MPQQLLSDKRLAVAIEAFESVIGATDRDEIPHGLIDADRIALLAMRELRELRLAPETPAVATDPCRVAAAIGLLERFRDGRISSLQSSHESILGCRAQLENERDIFGYAIDALRTLPARYGVAQETPAARDADHCDFPDCEQHNSLVVAQLQEALDWVLRERITLHNGAFFQRAEVNHPNPDCGWYSFPSHPDRISSTLNRARERAAQKANACQHSWTVLGPPRDPRPDDFCDHGCGLRWKDRDAVNGDEQR